MSAGWPYKCTGSSARVRAVIARSAAAGSSVSRSGSMSANTGRAPAITIAIAVYAAESGVVTTSSPAPMPSARRINASASVPLPTPTAYGAPRRRGEFTLERLDLGPQHEPRAVHHARHRLTDGVRLFGEVEIQKGDSTAHATVEGVGAGSSRYAAACAR